MKGLYRQFSALTRQLLDWKLIVVAACLAQPTFACQCVPESIEQKFARADAVFKGGLVDMADGITTIDVFESYKGSAAHQQVSVDTLKLTSCEALLEPGVTYILFAQRDQQRLSINKCNLRIASPELQQALNKLTSNINSGCE